MTPAHSPPQSASAKTILARELHDGMGGVFRDRVITIDGGGMIAGIEEAGGEPIAEEYPIIAPGFIDLQINGAGGVLFNDTPDAGSIKTIAAAARKGGAAHILPTFITAPDYIKALATAKSESVMADPAILGLHLEGPFLSPDKPGIHPAKHIRKISDGDVDALCAAVEGFTKANRRLLLTIAPEETDITTINRLAQSGIIVFAGHSLASAEQITAATDAGLTGITHLFNAMNPLTAREPGIIGAALASPDLYASIIADGYHVHRDNLRLAAANMKGRLFLISDAMPSYGVANPPPFMLGDAEITLQNGRLVDAKATLAGAHIGLDDALRHMVKSVDVPLREAIPMASHIPAKALGLGDSYGAIAPGRPASLTCLDGNLKTRAVYVCGTRHAQ